MTEGISLADIMKSLPTATTYSGKSVLTVDSSGALSKLSLDKVLINRGSASDLNEATMLGIYTPATTGVLNAPDNVTVNTSDTIMNVGNTPNYFEQLYISLFSTSLFKRSYRGANGGGWSSWVRFVSETA